MKTEFPEWYAKDLEEVAAAKKRLEESKLPILLYYSIDPLQFSGDGRPMYYHRRIYYFPDVDAVKEDVQFTNNGHTTDNVLPGTVNLAQALAKYAFGEKPIEVAKAVSENIKATIDHMVASDNVGSWEQLGMYLLAYYNLSK